MNILWGWLSPVRAIFLWVDCIAFSLLDDVFNIFQILASNEIISADAVKSLMNNIYILVGVVAFFRLALLLINSIINPEKLTEKKEGLSTIVIRVVAMLSLLVFSPLIFNELNEIQKTIVDENIITKTIIGSSGVTDIKDNKSSNYFVNAGKTMQKVVITALIKPEDTFFLDGEAGVAEYLDNKNIDDSFTNGPKALDGYVTEDCKTNCRRAMAQYHQMISQDAKGGFKLRRLTAYITGSAEVPVEGSNGDSEDVYYYEYYAGVTTITAVFLTYVVLSWCIDIGVRSVELAVLRVISPLFIATIVDPKSTASGGYFSNWLKRFGKTYADLFLKLAIISVAILFISLIQDADIWNTVVGGN